MTQTELSFAPVRLGKIHAAKLERSPRLQRFLAVLSQHPEGISTLDLQHRAGVCNAHSCASEVRANGIGVTVWQERGIYFYKMEQQK